MAPGYRMTPPEIIEGGGETAPPPFLCTDSGHRMAPPEIIEGGKPHPHPFYAMFSARAGHWPPVPGKSCLQKKMQVDGFREVPPEPFTPPLGPQTLHMMERGTVSPGRICLAGAIRRLGNVTKPPDSPGKVTHSNKDRTGGRLRPSAPIRHQGSLWWNWTRRRGRGHWC